MADKVLYVAGCESGKPLPGAALEGLGAAKTIAQVTGGELAVGLVGSSVDGALGVAGCEAVSGVLKVEDAALDKPRYATDVSALEALVKTSGAGIVLACSDFRWARALPGAAERCGGVIDTEVTAFDQDGDSLCAERWYYRQRMKAKLSREKRPWFMTVASGCFSAAEVGEVGVAESVAADFSGVRTEVTGIEKPAEDSTTIRPEAELLFVAGAGWTKQQPDGEMHEEEAERCIADFLRKSKASLGSSKSIVDLAAEGHAVLGFMTHLHQIGQTGATPRHEKGLSTCCHGEEPHVVGWRFINQRRAISLDPNCGWAQGKADVLYVADAFEVMRMVNDLL